MSNCYTNSCFAFIVTAAEAALLREAIELAADLEDEPDPPAIAELWQHQSDRFRTLFAAIGDNPISGFLTLFPDADYPTFGTTFSFDEQNDTTVRVFGTADQFEPDAVAELFRRVIAQSLPVRVTWSFDSDRHHPDAFGGGGFLIDTAGVHWIGTSLVHDRGWFSPKLVIAMRDKEEGLLFWNDNQGFGSLETAQVYTEEQALKTDLPIADDQPEWLALPSSLTA